MLTLTIPHGAHDSLVDLLAKLTRAMEIFRNDRTYRAIAKEHFGSVVRATETTHGGNGWHPHFHMLLFLKGSLDAVALGGIRARLSAVWQAAAQSAGLGCPDFIAGCNLVAGVSVDERLAEYCSKISKTLTPEAIVAYRKKTWGVEREMARLHSKKSAGGLSPFQILDLLSGPLSASLRQRLFILFIEYATSMRGQRQLVWQRGFKATLVALGATFDERSDDEVAAAPAADESPLVWVPAASWRWIVGLGLASQLIASCEEEPSAASQHLADTLLAVDCWRQYRKRSDLMRPPPDSFAATFAA